MGPRRRLAIASPFILFAYPAAALLGGTSQTALVLGRYSYAAAGFILAAALLYVLFAIGLLRRSIVLLILATLALVGLTFVLPSSNNVLAWPGTLTVLALVRMASAVSLVAVAASGARLGATRWQTTALMTAGLLAVPSAIDAGFLVSQGTGAIDGSVKSLGVSYRTSYDLTRLDAHDVVLVGDSFVWGEGVEMGQRVGEVLQALLQEQDPDARVYSLGVIGVGLNDYVKSLRQVPPDPKVRRVIVAFYQNDMPARETFAGRLEALSLAIGRSSISARLLLDAARVSLAPTVEGYMKQLLGDFDENGRDYPARWAMLASAFDELFALADQRSIGRPVMAIIPALSPTDGERWRAIHRRVAARARAAGFEVVDLYDAFATGTPATVRYRATPNDLHFDVEGNRIFAEKLFEALQPRPARN
ncbi:MAG: SGNH/GDSL hydrolase family protein [Pseudomonadota bacterium]